MSKPKQIVCSRRAARNQMEDFLEASPQKIAKAAEQENRKPTMLGGLGV
jgi:hypothetical protein